LCEVFFYQIFLMQNWYYPPAKSWKPSNRNRCIRNTHMGGNGSWYFNRRLSRFRLLGPISNRNRPMSSPSSCK